MSAPTPISNFTLTAANSVFMLSIADLFDVPQQLQGFAADDMADTDDVEPGEAIMGVDGFMSVGYTPFITKQKIAIQSDSLSARMFEDWLAAEKAAQEKYICNATLTIPGIARVYTMTRGILIAAKQVPPIKKLLQPRTFVIAWQSVDPASI